MFAGASSRLKDIPRGVWALGLVKLRGAASGVFNLASGAALLLASVVAGLLWDAFGPTATFLAGAGISAVALAGLLAVSKRLAVPMV